MFRTLRSRLTVLTLASAVSASANAAPSLIVLGIAQDAGVPQLGQEHQQREPRLAASLAVIGDEGQRWLIDATPDLREQMRLLHRVAPVREGGPYLDGVFLTHAHIGHYAGLMFLGHESMGARGIRVYAMPRMAAFLTDNGPWSQLVKYDNIVLTRLTADAPVALDEGLTITPIEVPHRQEFAEVVGYRIEGPRRSALYIPDIDSWAQWAEQGVEITDEVKAVDIALLDATFFADGEVPGRDMSGFPHPRIVDSMERLGHLTEDRRIYFIHLNHTNPALHNDSDVAQLIRDQGFHLARRGERIEL